MMVHRIALILVIGAALLAPAVSAMIVEEKDGYTVTAEDSTRLLPALSRFSSSWVSQGQTVSYATYVPQGRNSFVSDLYWGNTANLLSLTVNAPDSTLGPYYDAADGRTDGRINLRFSKPGGISSGSWRSYIFGYSVTGVQSFTYTTSAT